ncbi:hypothetical protein E2C06_06960 [Dankookia rubra]|uniref:Ig-like domain-containing protein n=1 Tax=Dankookia rubra TaxID=1442381 RepID=A0A4R5QJT6_9PROT|nr:hypothetical protein [Dankookia rubra]TDH63118.1 hypothetical protein E2C06_06960 [Dankookia rubra]
MLRGSQGNALAFATLAALLACVAPAVATARSSPQDDDVVLPGVSNLDECGGNVPSCSTVRTPVITVKAGQQQRVKVLCGSDTFFWNWTAQGSPLLSIVLWSQFTPTAVPVRDAQNRPIGAVFLMDEQTGSRDGKGRISIGCSPEDPTGSLLTQRTHITSNPRRYR